MMRRNVRSLGFQSWGSARKCSGSFHPTLTEVGVLGDRSQASGQVLSPDALPFRVTLTGNLASA